MLTTTVAQGKKLLELGLDSNTADLCYLSQTPQGDPVYFKRNLICQTFKLWKLFFQP